MRDIINKALISRTSIKTREQTRMTRRLLEDSILTVSDMRSDLDRLHDDLKQALANIESIEQLQTTAIERQA